MNMIREQVPGEIADPSGARPGRQRHRRRKLIEAGAVVVIAAAAAAVVITGLLRSSPSSSSPGLGATALATVTERSLSSQTKEDATLGYARDYSVVVPSAGGGQSSPSGQGSPGRAGGGMQADPSGVGQPGSGTFTRLPIVGKVIRQGHAAYDVNGWPVVLLYGSTPAYRSLSEGMSGGDIRSVNADLIALGYAARAELSPGSSYFSAATAAALAKLQAKLGVSQTGSLPLGHAVFLPTAARVTSVAATLGAPVQRGALVLQATSTQRQVTAQIDATEQADVAKGDKVTITLPSNQTTPGVVTSVGTVAAVPSSGSGSGTSSGVPGSSSSPSSSGTATAQVNIKLSDRKAIGLLTQAPVQVTITTGTVKHALVVPVDALLARASVGYAVEVVSASGNHHVVPVSLGIFDDADGLVQVTSPGLSAGQRVVVPKI